MADSDPTRLEAESAGNDDPRYSIARLIVARIAGQRWSVPEVLPLCLLVAVLLYAIGNAVSAIWGGFSYGDVGERVSNAFQWANIFSAVILVVGLLPLWWHAVTVGAAADSYVKETAEWDREGDPLDPFERLLRTMWLASCSGILLVVTAAGAIIYLAVGWYANNGPQSIGSGQFTTGIFNTLATMSVVLGGLCVAAITRRECASRFDVDELSSEEQALPDRD